MFMLVVNVMFLILGCLFDTSILLLVVIPMLVPSCRALGIDLVYFGVVVVVNMMIGLITPPVGSVLFVASAVSKQKIETVVKAMLPFYAMLLIVLGMVTYIPAISLWLPGVLGMQ